MKNPLTKLLERHIDKALESKMDVYIRRLEKAKRELESDVFWTKRDDDAVKAIIEAIKNRKGYSLFWLGSSMRPDGKLDSAEYIVENVTKYFSAYAPAFFSVGKDYHSYIFEITDELHSFFKMEQLKNI